MLVALLIAAGTASVSGPFRIVGVVADVQQAPIGQAAEPVVYHTQRQFPFRKMFVAVRGHCMERRMPIRQLVQTTAWKRYSGAARTALARLRSSLAAVA